MHGPRHGRARRHGGALPAVGHRGVLGNSIVVSTRLTSGLWTAFFDEVSASTVLLFAQSPGIIPALACGDVLTFSSGKSGGKGRTHAASGRSVGNVAVVYRALKAEWAPQSEIVLPVVAVGDAGATVVGFVTVQVDKIRASGNPKYVAGTILSLDLLAAE